MMEISEPTGLIVIGGIEQIEQRWIGRGKSQKGVAVDFHGPHAERIAARNAPHPRELLPDGTVRIVFKDPGMAGQAFAGARTHIVEQGWADSDTVELLDVGSTKKNLKDAVRAVPVAAAEEGSYIAIRGKSAVVTYEEDDAGLFIRIRVS